MVSEDDCSSPVAQQASFPKLPATAHIGNLTVLQINLRHSRAASILLMKTVLDHNVDVVLIQEPYATKKSTIELQNVPPGFTAYHRLDGDHQYGSAVLIKSAIESKLLEEATDNQVTCVQIFNGNEAVLLVSAYCRPSTQGVETVISHPLRHLSSLLPRSLIALDSNARNVLWNSRRTDDRGRELENLALRSGLSFANRRKEELGFVPAGTSFVDVTLVGSMIETGNWRYLEDHSLSDHPYIIVELVCSRTTRRKRHPSKERAPRTDEIDATKFKTIILSRIESADLDLAPTTEEEVDKFAERFTTAIVSSACLSKERKRREQGNKAPWWSTKLEALRTSTRRAYKRWSSAKTERSKMDLKIIRREYRKEMRRAAAVHFKEFCIKNMNDDLLVALKEISSEKRTDTQPTEMMIEGVLVTEPKKILESFSDHFFQRECESNEGHSRIEETAEMLCEPSPQEIPPPVTQSEIRRALQEMRKTAAPGNDGVTVPLLLIALGVIAPVFVTLFNACFSMGTFPSVWKEAMVAIVPKPGKSSYAAVESYRPISILSALGKLLEKVILNRLTWLAEWENWLSDGQHGFRRSRSTESALHAIISQIEDSFAARSFTASVLIDIKSAFDAAWHPAIISALGEKRCPRYLIRIVASFLKCRRAALSLREIKILVAILLGCPQGSMLSPFLWNVLLDAMLRLKLPPGVKIVAYADDVTILATDRDPATAVRKAQEAVEIIQDWLRRVKLRVNAMKTVLIVFSKRKVTLPPLSLIVDGQVILPSSSAKLLGVTIDKHLRWTDHVEDRELMFKRTLHSIRRYLGKTWGLSQYRMKTLYTAAVEPVLPVCVLGLGLLLTN